MIAPGIGIEGDLDPGHVIEGDLDLETGGGVLDPGHPIEAGDRDLVHPTEAGVPDLGHVIEGGDAQVTVATGGDHAQGHMTGEGAAHVTDPGTGIVIGNLAPDLEIESAPPGHLKKAAKGHLVQGHVTGIVMGRGDLALVHVIADDLVLAHMTTEGLVQSLIQTRMMITLKPGGHAPSLWTRMLLTTDLVPVRRTTLSVGALGHLRRGRGRG